MTSHVLLTLTIGGGNNHHFPRRTTFIPAKLKVRRRLKLSNIFTNITHELLTPLTVISASVDRIAE